uniref:Ig-like domain-containing protein n=1 Tax=Callorhinchus milii TaxID=7868 RepID=A0A4W3GG34_CALMI
PTLPLYQLLSHWKNGEERVANAISVQPSQMEVSVGEGQTANMSCTYSADFTDVLMYWYLQYPGDPPLYTRRHNYGGDTFSAEFAKQRFSTNLDTNTKRYSLTLFPVALSDMATYYCAIRLTVFCRTPRSCLSGLTQGDSVTQKVASVTGKEGGSVTIDCHDDTSLSDYYLHWYREQQERQPQYMLKKYSNGNTYKADFAEKRFSVELQTSTKSCCLTIFLLELSDSAVYYCAGNLLLVCFFSVNKFFLKIMVINWSLNPRKLVGHCCAYLAATIHSLYIVNFMPNANHYYITVIIIPPVGALGSRITRI